MYIDDLILLIVIFQSFMQIFMQTSLLNIGNISINYLDLILKNVNEAYYIDFYNNRNDFNFEIRVMPHWNSNLNLKKEKKNIPQCFRWSVIILLL